MDSPLLFKIVARENKTDRENFGGQKTQDFGRVSFSILCVFLFLFLNPLPTVAFPLTTKLISISLEPEIKQYFTKQGL